MSFHIFTAEKDVLKKHIKTIHEEVLEHMRNATILMSLDRFDEALDEYYTAYTLYRDCIMPWLNTWLGYQFSMPKPLTKKTEDLT